VSSEPRESSPKSPASHGPVRNTLVQLAAQLTGAGFTAALTLYLVRALGAKGYGAFALAVSISLLVLLPSDFGLSAAVARFLAERREDRLAASTMLVRGLQLKVIAGVAATVALFALSEPIARAYGDSSLTWPLRWISIALFGQGLVYFLNATFAAVRTTSRSLKMFTAESAVETTASVLLVALGAGVAGAALGRAVGYAVGALVGLLLAAPIIRPVRAAWRRRRSVPVRMVGGYAGAMMIVDAAHTAIVQVDVVLIGAILSVGAAGPFAAVSRLFIFLTYLGNSVAAGVAPRLSRTPSSEPDADTFTSGLRYIILLQGVLVAPLVIWAQPIVTLALGSGYQSSVGVMRALAPTVVLGGLAPVLALGVNYLGEARRRVPIMLVILVLGVGSTYILVRAVGVVGAAIADDIILLAHVVAHLWICSDLIDIDLRKLMFTVLRTLGASIVMGAVLAAFGVSSLSAVDWIVGGTLGTLSFGLALVAVRELSVDEVRSLSRASRSALRRRKPARAGV
jgi:O-antigen/teichoic acid export membrane protein